MRSCSACKLPARCVAAGAWATSWLRWRQDWQWQPCCRLVTDNWATAQMSNFSPTVPALGQPSDTVLHCHCPDPTNSPPLCLVLSPSCHPAPPCCHCDATPAIPCWSAWLSSLPGALPPPCFAFSPPRLLLPSTVVPMLYILCLCCSASPSPPPRAAPHPSTQPQVELSVSFAFCFCVHLLYQVLARAGNAVPISIPF